MLSGVGSLVHSAGLGLVSHGALAAGEALKWPWGRFAVL